jgi:hypothetical protein
MGGYAQEKGRGKDTKTFSNRHAPACDAKRYPSGFRAERKAKGEKF